MISLPKFGDCEDHDNAFFAMILLSLLVSTETMPNKRKNRRGKQNPHKKRVVPRRWSQRKKGDITAEMFT